MTIEQTRVRRGVRQGGQFAAEQHNEPSFNLTGHRAEQTAAAQALRSNSFSPEEERRIAAKAVSAALQAGDFDRLDVNDQATIRRALHDPKALRLAVDAYVTDVYKASGSSHPLQPGKAGIHLGEHLLRDAREKEAARTTDFSDANDVEAYVQDLQAQIESLQLNQANAQARVLAADLQERHPDVYGVLVYHDDGHLLLEPYDGDGHEVYDARVYLRDQSHLNLDNVHHLKDILIGQQSAWEPEIEED